MRVYFVFILIISLMFPITSCAQTELIESVSTQYDNIHPGLESYRVRLKTNKIDEMLTRMTASMPKDMPRPEAPELMKFWDRDSGHVIRSMGQVAFGYKQQMIDRFSKRFAIDLRTLLLPTDKVDMRARLLKNASIKGAETEIGDQRLHRFEIVFEEPADLAGAFYDSGLELPQRNVTELVLDIDPGKKILVHMDIKAKEKLPLAVEIRHLDAKGHFIPREVSVTSPDGSIDERLVTTFEQIQGFWLPVKQVRDIRRPGLEEQLIVDFFKYELVTSE